MPLVIAQLRPRTKDDEAHAAVGTANHSLQAMAETERYPVPGIDVYVCVCVFIVRANLISSAPNRKTLFHFLDEYI